MSISPDGSNLYVPSFEKDHWHVVDGKDGHIIAKIEPRSGSHNTVYGPDGKSVYLAGLRSPILTIADAGPHAVWIGRTNFGFLHQGPMVAVFDDGDSIVRPGNHGQSLAV